MINSGQNELVSGLVAGAGAGVAQTSVMGPCTFIVTAIVTGDKNMKVGKKITDTWKTNGIKGFYPGGSAIAMRQATNWASRQGFTEAIRVRYKIHRHGDRNHRLTNGEEALCGLVGGALSTWNQPFEVARIQMQAAASAGEAKLSMVKTMQKIVAEYGPQGLFKGIIPRMGLGAWQTLFMVTGAKIMKNYMEPAKSHEMVRQKSEYT